MQVKFSYAVIDVLALADGDDPVVVEPSAESNYFAYEETR